MPQDVGFGELENNVGSLDIIKEKPGGLGDYGRALAAGAYGTVGSLAAGADYLLDTDPDSALSATQDWARSGERSQIAEMSPGAQRDYGAGFLPGEGKDIWDDDVSIARSLGLKVAGASPSLIASVLPGGIAASAARAAAVRLGASAATAGRAGIAAGVGTSGAVNADMMAGDVYNDIKTNIREAKDDELQKQSGLYRYLRERGQSEDVAKKVLVEYAAGNKPLIAGAIGALAEQLGAAGAAVKKGAGVATDGALKNAVKTGIEEGVTEAGQSAGQEAITQQGNIEAGTQADFDWRKVLEQGVQGGAVGGILGAGVGSVTGGRARSTADVAAGADTDADIPADLSTVTVEPTAELAAGKTPETVEKPIAVDHAAEAQRGLDEIDGMLARNRDNIAKAEAGEPITPEGNVQEQPSRFEPQNEFEVDPDAPEVQSVAQDAPVVPEVAAGQAEATPTLPDQPAELPAAGDPSEAIVEPSATTTGGQDFSLDDLPPVPEPVMPRDSGPRVLNAQIFDTPTEVAPKRDQRMSAKERANIAAGKSAAGTLSQNPADWKKQSDRKSVAKLVDAEIEAAAKAGREPKAWAADIASVRGKTVGQGPTAKANQQKYNTARQALADETNEAIQSGAARRETVKEQAERAATEKKEADSRTIKQIIDLSPVSLKAGKGFPGAVRDHAKLVLDVAKKAGIRPGEGNTTDPYQLYLKNAQAAASDGSSKDVRDQFMTDDFFIRNNAGDELVARRKAQAEKVGPSYDEVSQAPRREAREGTDESEVYNAGGMSETIASEESEQETAQDQPGPTPRQPEIPVDRSEPTGAAGVVGQNRAGTFAVQKSRSRTLAPGAAARLTERNPTDAQKKAGNYAKGHTRVFGLDVAIENAKGSTRSGTDAGGKAWSVKLPAHYGYIKRSTGADGDHVDTYLGPLAGFPHYQKSGEVVVVNQQNLDGKFDEHKVMLGFRNVDEAMKAYKAAFSDGKGAQRVQSVARMTPDDFKVWLDNGDTKKPAVDEITAANQVVDAQEAAIADARGKLRIIYNEQKTALEKIDDFFDAAEINKTFVDRIMAVRADLKKAIGGERGLQQIMDKAKKDAFITPEGNAPTIAARERTGEEHLRYLQNNWQRGEPVRRGQTIFSPRTFESVEALRTEPLGDMLADTDVTTVGGVNVDISKFFKKQLQNMVAEVPVHIITQNDMVKLTADLIESGNWGSVPLGYYESTLHAIVLSDAAIQTQAALGHLLLHEGMHAAFLDLIARQPTVKSMISDLMEYVKDKTGKSMYDFYGLTNEDEFISEAFSSRQFQEFLASVPVPNNLSTKIGKLANVWEFFIQTVRRFLKFRPGQESALDTVLRVGAIMTQARSDVMGPSSPRAASPMFAQQQMQQNVRDAMSDRAVSASGKISRKWMRFKTMDQFRQAYGRYFDGWLDKAVDQMQRMQVFVSQERQKGEDISAKFLDLYKRDPKLAQKTAELRNRITEAEVNLLPGKPTMEQLQQANRHIFGNDPKKSDISEMWQSKSLIEGLQKEFSALPAEIQQQMLNEGAYYRGNQNRITRELVGNIIKYFGGDTPIANPDQLVTKVMSGTLTEDDAKALGNASLVNALKEARQLRAVRGMYFPLIRHGDFVVRTRERIDDLMGGTEVVPGVVEFKAGTDKAARAAANAFAKKTGLKQTRVAKVYYDPATGERVKNEDRRAGFTVGYRVSVQKEGFHAFNTETEAAAFVREAKAQGGYESVSNPMVKDEVAQQSDLTHTQLRTLLTSAKQRDDIPESVRNMMATAIAQGAIRLMPGTRFQSRALPRKYVQGASKEYARTALAYGQSSASYLGKLRYMPEVRDAMDAMSKMTHGDRVYDKFGEVRRAVLQEFENRVNDNEIGLNKPSTFVQDLMQVAMLTRLAGPGHSIINATQVGMVTYPYLAGRHGAVSTAMEISRAYRDMNATVTVGQGVRNTFEAAKWNKVILNTTDLFGSIKSKLGRQSDGKALNAMLDKLKERGALDEDASFEMAAAVAGGRGAWGQGLSKLDRIFRQAPKAIEAINRTVTAVTAYRLARRNGKGDAEATQYAFDTVMNTQGDYSAMNASPFFNNKFARPFLQFKKYGQMMTNAYVDMAYRAFKDASPEERRVAQKQLAHLIATQVMIAGVLSVPGMEIIKMGAIIAGVMGVGNGWDDQERWIKKLADENLGKTWSELVRKGVISRAAGIDLSSRLSFADMWTFGEPKKYDKSGISAWLADQILGAPGGTSFDFRDGLVAATEGDWMKAAEKALPVKVLTDTAKAMNALNKGDMGVGEAALKVLSIRSARAANQQEAKSEQIAEGIKLKDARNKVRNNYLNARTAGERLKQVAKVREYNKTAPSGQKLSVASMNKILERDRKAGLRP